MSALSILRNPFIECGKALQKENVEAAKNYMQRGTFRDDIKELVDRVLGGNFQCIEYQKALIRMTLALNFLREDEGIRNEEGSWKQGAILVQNTLQRRCSTSHEQ